MLFLLGLVQFLITRRVASLEKKYLRVAREADELVCRPLLREGNSQRDDVCQAAKRQYLLGLLTQKARPSRDALHAGQAASDGMAKLIGRVRGLKGRTLPYTFGAFDVAFFVTLADYLGFGQHVSRHVVQMIMTWLQK